MFQKWQKYSYADQKTYLSRIRLLVLKVVFIVLAYLMLTNIFFPMILMESASMQPSINPGDRFIFSAFSIKEIIPGLPFFDEIPYERGDIVTINLAAAEEDFFVKFTDRLVRFFTAGKIGLSGKDNQFFIKRIIGLPGDEVSMTNFVMHVKPAGSPYTLTEYELSGERIYKIDIPQVPAIWDASIPFSGNMPKLMLGEDQCFVLSDDRSNTNDSRTWGPIPLGNITGKAIFRYWPPNRLGRP